ncbi:CTD kinase subunit alpha [Smittium culicis]|uniref:cyclin-dependent kinase n=1 Tax=Smittium culicis TaxID=133412 RepID=A0A1R1Y8A0_9FUNG|nr:CTD kinase subunit alpha [Smittium culicis]
MLNCIARDYVGIKIAHTSSKIVGSLDPSIKNSSSDTNRISINSHNNNNKSPNSSLNHPKYSEINLKSHPVNDSTTVNAHTSTLNQNLHNFDSKKARANSPKLSSIVNPLLDPNSSSTNPIQAHDSNYDKGDPKDYSKEYRPSSPSNSVSRFYNENRYKDTDTSVNSNKYSDKYDSRSYKLDKYNDLDNYDSKDKYITPTKNSLSASRDYDRYSLENNSRVYSSSRYSERHIDYDSASRNFDRSRDYDKFKLTDEPREYGNTRYRSKSRDLDKKRYNDDPREYRLDDYKCSETDKLGYIDKFSDPLKSSERDRTRESGRSRARESVTEWYREKEKLKDRERERGRFKNSDRDRYRDRARDSERDKTKDGRSDRDRYTDRDSYYDKYNDYYKSSDLASGQDRFKEKDKSRYDYSYSDYKYDRYSNTKDKYEDSYYSSRYDYKYDDYRRDRYDYKREDSSIYKSSRHYKEPRSEYSRTKYNNEDHYKSSNSSLIKDGFKSPSKYSHNHNALDSKHSPNVDESSSKDKDIYSHTYFQSGETSSLHRLLREREEAKRKRDAALARGEVYNDPLDSNPKQNPKSNSVPGAKALQLTSTDQSAPKNNLNLQNSSAETNSTLPELFNSFKKQYEGASMAGKPNPIHETPALNQSYSSLPDPWNTGIFHNNFSNLNQNNGVNNTFIPSIIHNRYSRHPSLMQYNTHPTTLPFPRPHPPQYHQLPILPLKGNSSLQGQVPPNPIDPTSIYPKNLPDNPSFVGSHGHLPSSLPLSSANKSQSNFPVQGMHQLKVVHNNPSVPLNYLETPSLPHNPLSLLDHGTNNLSSNNTSIQNNSLVNLQSGLTDKNEISNLASKHQIESDSINSNPNLSSISSFSKAESFNNEKNVTSDLSDPIQKGLIKESTVSDNKSTNEVPNTDLLKGIDYPIKPSTVYVNKYKNSSKLKSKFEILTQVGEGTYGKVFKANMVNSEGSRLVALKRIRIDQERDGFPITAMREIKIMKSLDHPNIVKLVDVVSNSDRDIYMVMEYLGYDLSGLLARSDWVLEQENIKSLVHQILSGLNHMHEYGIIHRDIKGSNILLNDKGELKIVDFGLARHYEAQLVNTADPSLNYTNRVITLWYRPPELLLGTTKYGPEVDIWSVGCVMAELFTKKPTFQGTNELSTLAQIFSLLGPPLKKPQKPEGGNISIGSVKNRGHTSNDKNSSSGEEEFVDYEYSDYYKGLPWFNMMHPKVSQENKSSKSGNSNIFSSLSKLTSKCGLDLISEMLNLEPSLRPTAKACLNHDYFTKDLPKMVPVSRFPISGDWHDYESKADKKKKSIKPRKD